MKEFISSISITELELEFQELKANYSKDKDESFFHGRYSLEKCYTREQQKRNNQCYVTWEKSNTMY